MNSNIQVSQTFSGVQQYSTSVDPKTATPVLLRSGILTVWPPIFPLAAMSSLPPPAAAKPLLPPSLWPMFAARLTYQLMKSLFGTLKAPLLY